MNKEQRKEFLREHWRISTLCFKWSNNGVCRIYDFRGEKTKFYAGGYGYDKQGSCLAGLMNHYFKDDLKRLESCVNSESFQRRKGFYGLHHYNIKTGKYQKRSSKYTRTHVDGACGFNSMKSILYKLGFTMEFVYESKNSNIYIVREA